jgi:hypothetical protein
VCCADGDYEREREKRGFVKHNNHIQPWQRVFASFIQEPPLRYRIAEKICFTKPESKQLRERRGSMQRGTQHSKRRDIAETYSRATIYKNTIIKAQLKARQ